MSVPTLVQTQRLLWKLITAPEGAAPGLAALDPLDRSVVDGLVRAGGRLSPVARLDIYADMYFYRLRDCLKEDFATVYAVIGEAGFHNLITDYLVEYPPAHFSLRHAGRYLPGFIRRHAVSTRWPFLEQLAVLEWAILDACDASEGAPLNLTDLQAQPPDEWPQLRFDLVPSLQCLHVDWRVDELCRRLRDAPEQVLGEPRHEATWLRVWRQQLRVFHRPIEPAEVRALLAIAAGEPLGLVCERIAELVPEEAAERAADMLGQWTTDAVLVRPAEERSPAPSTPIATTPPGSRM